MYRAMHHQRTTRKHDQYVVSREDQYAVLEIWKVNILEDIKHGLRKKSRLSLKNDMPPRDKEKEKITVWEELVEKFFCKFYPDSYDKEEEMMDEGDNWGIDPLKFISRVNSSFEKHMKMDGRTKKVIFHAWMNGSWNKRHMDDSILSSNDTTTDSFFRPYLKTSEKNETEKDNELSQTKGKCSNTSPLSIDEQPYKRTCKQKI
ncbi:hypothetical protein Tco_0078135 [Tanacetum coccineum]